MKPLHICDECKGSGYVTIPSTDIHGDFTHDIIDCPDCDGTGLVEK
jgi:DnaJ-class molecular chaperone